MSRRRTKEPSGRERITIAPNASGSASRPRTDTLYWNCWSRGAGICPTWPAGACRFCSLTARITSAGVSPREAMRSGLSQMRMPKSEPNICTLPTPLTRLSAWITLMDA